MHYIYFEFEKEQFFIELDTENRPQRQIILYPNGTYEISCRDNCLAEGEIDLETSKDITNISFALFENNWNEFTASHRSQWNMIKENYPIGRCVTGIIKYFYPQGARVNLGTVQGILPNNCENVPTFIDCVVQGVVSGYDEQNMWIVLEDVNEIKLEDCFKPFLSLLRCAFPHGIDEKNYFLLLYLLYDDFCDENLAKLMSLVMDKKEALVSNDMGKAFSMDFDRMELETLEMQLKQYGLDKLRKKS